GLEWHIFNSTVQTLFPTFALATSFKGPDEDQPQFFGLAEIHAQKLYSNVLSRANQELIVIDSHKNILISTREKWDPSDVVFGDEQAMKVISGMKPGSNLFEVFEYPNRPAMATSIFKLQEGGGVSLVVQEPLEHLQRGEKQIQDRSLVIAAVILIIT